jgi:hypothetical protein
MRFLELIFCAVCEIAPSTRLLTLVCASIKTLADASATVDCGESVVVMAFEIARYRAGQQNHATSDSCCTHWKQRLWTNSEAIWFGPRSLYSCSIT